MRKFRGKLKNKYTEEWFYGDLITVKNEDGTTDYYIIADDYTSEGNIIELDTCQSPKVETDTIGQSTGIKDKNGVEIYEGDIVRLKSDSGACEMIGMIIYDKYDLAFELKDIYEGTQECLWYQEQELEVIGNIYDNKELLEE